MKHRILKISSLAALVRIYSPSRGRGGTANWRVDREGKKPKRHIKRERGIESVSAQVVMTGKHIPIPLVYFDERGMLGCPSQWETT